MSEEKRIEGRIAELEYELESARNDLQGVKNKAKSPEEHLAVHLHDKFCPLNHTDGCEWEYEVSWTRKKMWEGHAHKRWLEEAEKLTRFLE